MLNLNTAKAVQILRDRKIIEKNMKGVLLLRDCVLIERPTEKTYTYTLYNYITGEKKYIGHNKYQADECALYKFLPKIVKQKIFNKAIPKGENLIRYIFEKVFSSYGYALREEQIDLSLKMLKAMKNNEIQMSDVAVGFGKTHAYLAAGIVYYHEQNTRRKTILVSTSSKELQRAIIEEYLPDISKMLLEYGIINEEIKAVLRKGKENYICHRRLSEYIQTIKRSKKPESQYNALLELRKTKTIDLDKASSISKYDRARIKLQGSECKTCPKSHMCPYRMFMNKAMRGDYIFQVCNHNYYTVDAKNKHIKQGKALLPAYSAVIIDEAHKLDAAAIQTYSTVIDFQKVEKYMKDRSANKRKSTSNKVLSKLCYDIENTCNKIKEALYKQVAFNRETLKYSVEITQKIKTMLLHLSSSLLQANRILVKHNNYSLRKLISISRKIESLFETDCITYIENFGNKYVLVGVPKEINTMIKQHLFCGNHSVVLTSGTLAVNDNFEYIKQLLGLDNTARRISYVAKKSPFNYTTNSMLYFSSKTIYPDYTNEEYIKGIANEIHRLIRASHGHALVLFTSYTAMRQVYEMLRKKEYPYPIYKTSKGNGYAVNQFRKNNNAVLLGCGSMWEGVNFAGDMLSHLIIAKLPFLIPDPITEYKRSELNNDELYKRQILIPQMLLKLKQGHGRAIRTETDTAVISILDCRANGAYREPILKALPECRVTTDIEQVKRFFKAKKSNEYWRKGYDSSTID